VAEIKVRRRPFFNRAAVVSPYGCGHIWNHMFFTKSIFKARLWEEFFHGTLFHQEGELIEIH